MLKDIKHQFMAFRNGVIADTLRKAGMPYPIIFGLQLPQISQIAKGLEKSLPLARELWADRNVRESRLLACYLFPMELLDREAATDMAADVITREEADILAFRLLRNHPQSREIAESLEAMDNPLPKYAAQAILRNLD